MSAKQLIGAGKKNLVLMTLAALSCLLAACTEGADTAADSERFGTVKIIRAEQGDSGTDCWIEAELTVIGDEEFGADIRGGLDEEWQWWNSLDGMQQALSSSLPGYCVLNFDTWEACEAAIGVSIDNPLETYDWLETADHLGIALDTPVAFGERKHIEITYQGSSDGDISYVNVGSGYRYGDLRVMIRVTLDSDDDGGYRFGIDWNDGTVFEIEEYGMKNGNIAQLVTPQGAGNYSSAESYFVQDGLLYRIHIVGSLGQESEVRQALEWILTEFK
ncbi:MAG: hypothetical protein IJZ85_14210 [Lachnospiraceae bacterium]|nr:hypothetical protein [Lachnospiraceae bacterium]